MTSQRLRKIVTTPFHTAENHETEVTRLAVVIPTFNAAASLAKTLSNVERCLSDVALQIVIADGGSTDDTVEIATHCGASIVTTTPGRGAQLRAATAQLDADWLLFLHADTTLDTTALSVIERFVRNPDNARRAGYFRFTLDDDSEDARRLERRVAWRCKTFALPYGDQGLLISRRFYEDLGGFKPIPLMEDVDMAWRIQKAVGKDGLVALSADAVTSAAKFKQQGYFKRSARNLFCLFLFRIGIPPRVIKRFY
ncbi:MAG: TIGR04283 family arsenosugar biosynthesis glycosyltransferase [Pseudomonadota bacterium]